MRGIGAHEIARIVACDRARCRQHGNQLGCDCAAAGLIAGTVPMKGMLGKVARRCGSTSVEAVLQAMTTASGAKTRDEPRHDRADARDRVAPR